MAEESPVAAAPPPGWKPALRAVAFALLAAGALAALAIGATAPRTGGEDARWAELYLQAGDTFVRVYYLTAVAGGEEDRGQRFLRNARDYYRLAAQADPAEVRSAASLSLVLDELGEEEAARRWGARAARLGSSPSEAKALRALYSLVSSSEVDAEAVREASDYLSSLAPGRLALARAYERLGEVDLAERELAAAERESRSLLVSLLAMVVVSGLMLGAGVIGLVVGVRRLARRRAAAPAPEAEAPPAGWRVREAIEALIVWISLGVGLSGALGFLLPARWEMGPVVLLLPTVAAGLGAVGWVRIVSRGAPLGWRWERPWRQVLIGLSVAGLCTLPTLLLFKGLQTVLQRGPATHPLVPVFFEASGWADRAVLIVAACVVIPALEETLFRGVLYRSLRRQWSFAGAAAASAAVFAVGHLSTAGLLPYWLLGVLFAYVYERSGSLLVPAVVHGAFNGFNLAILLVLVG